MFVNPWLMGKTDISTNSILCSVVDMLSIVPNKYLSIACTVLDNISNAGNIAVRKKKTQTKRLIHTELGETE